MAGMKNGPEFILLDRGQVMDGDIEAFFAVFDTDGNGTIEVAELTRFLAIPDDGFTLETITNLIVSPQRKLPVDQRFAE